MVRLGVLGLNPKMKDCVPLYESTGPNGVEQRQLWEQEIPINVQAIGISV